MVTGHLVPPWLYHVFYVAGTTLVTLLIWLSGGGPVALGLAALYLFVPLDSFFFTRRAACLYLVYGTVACWAGWWPLGVPPLGLVLALTVVDVVAAVAVDRATDEAFAQAERTGRPFTVAYLDIDHFKTINDVGGHAAGDEVLREAAAAWLRPLPERAVLSRYGGDEFALLLPGCSVVTAWPRHRGPSILPARRPHRVRRDG